MDRSGSPSACSEEHSESKHYSSAVERLEGEHREPDLSLRRGAGERFVPTTYFTSWLRVSPLDSPVLDFVTSSAIPTWRERLSAVVQCDAPVTAASASIFALTGFLAYIVCHQSLSVPLYL
jgi:hypothetical protein